MADLQQEAKLRAAEYNEIRMRHPIKPRFRDCKNRNEYRRRMAAYRKALRDHWKAERDALNAAARAQNEAQREARHNETLTNKLLGSGKVSSENPTGRWGVVPQLLMGLIGVPILGLLYKLSFGVLAPFLVTILMLIVDKRSRQGSAAAWMLVWSVSYACAALTGHASLALAVFFTPFVIGLVRQLRD
ncbi:MAG TPA: hypothetical protein VJW51_09815 [Candidatus Acidoferrales bacterium]|nr:hypothetical protein [Candidatus Acidoferrales bacterium]